MMDCGTSIKCSYGGDWWNVCPKNDIIREDCDEYALFSHQRLILQEKGLLSSQMCNNVVNKDLFPKSNLMKVRSDTSIVKLSKLRPAFKEDGY